ncbi:hypothetical protein BH10ACT10_BH10ACT10_02310 [soil metagenome]
MTRVDDNARNLLREVGQAGPPVDVEAIAEHLGIRVVKTKMDDDVSGMLIREADTVTVGLNSGQALNRRRFTLAHEIGHLRLHRGRALILDSAIRVNYRDAQSARATDREEMEANRFAAELLMPAHMVMDAVTRLGPGQIDYVKTKLADQFAVSPEAIGYRLVNLGITS